MADAALAFVVPDGRGGSRWTGVHRWLSAADGLVSKPRIRI
jgi:hypothetical protein